MPFMTSRGQGTLKTSRARPETNLCRFLFQLRPFNKMVQPSPSWCLSTIVILIFLNLRIIFIKQDDQTSFQMINSTAVDLPPYEISCSCQSVPPTVSKKRPCKLYKESLPDTLALDEPKLSFLEFCLCWDITHNCLWLYSRCVCVCVCVCVRKRGSKQVKN